MTVIYVDNTDAVEQMTRAFVRRALARTAFKIMVDTKSSIQSIDGPADPDTPPHTHPRLLRSAIAYKVEETSAVIGPEFSLIGEVGRVHEFGGPYKDAYYRERPFQGPALTMNLDFFAAQFGGSIGE